MVSSRAVRVRISGRVQGVGFRAWVLHRAIELDLHGWVRNLTDGRVEILLSGPEPAITALIDLCWSGPSASAVTDVVLSEATGIVPHRFDVKPTVSPSSS